VNAEKLSELVRRLSSPGAAPTPEDRANIIAANALLEGKFKCCYQCETTNISAVGTRVLTARVGDEAFAVAICKRCRRRMDRDPVFASALQARVERHAAQVCAPLADTEPEGHA
jgi:hypothetical protein